MTKQRMHLGEILYKAGLVEKQALINAIKTAKTSNKRLGQVLIDLGLINEDTLAKAIAKQFGLKYVDVEQVAIPPDATKIVPEDLIKRHNILPLGVSDGRLRLVIGDPMDLDMMDSVRLRLSKELECSVGNPKKIRAYIEESLVDKSAPAVEDDRLKHSIDATAAELAEAGHELQAEALRVQAGDNGDEGPIIRLVNLIIDTAYHMRASDIHVEPMADRVRIRYRVDGVCLEKDCIPKNMQNPLVARFKILSGMDIAEKRLPQDGRIKRNIAGTDIDFRVSSLPGVHGPSVVLRILRPDAVNIGIESLGFEPDNYQLFQQIIKRPNGIFLVTGPTGSGKTTTLYAALQELNKPDKKIITAEDPVEYNFAGMNQCQVKEEIGLSFDKILRAMLRQAPNIILVGEIRDSEVADIAIQAALTGHLVFSTLHTNDACGAITRLIDMGVKPFLVASSIQAIMAQRLIRVICKKCKVVDEHPNPKHLRLLGIDPAETKKRPVYKGAGCSACHNTGYKGRLGIFEMIEMNPELRELAYKRATTSELRAAAKAGGMRTLAEDGVLKVFKGISTPEEVSRNAQIEGVVVEE
ncbi:MAG TPA: ATPase, T2SS/T4P/T4SS family [Sedimentisphaerales bacterium]|jgi:type IV pilus assembly protein PilB|nr:ATPase, T2SS/T4P/T4SS family [Sedimentisphaerales bacterium]HNU30207.1 ATPase, T2SS/T4P/T4SS family [Sedimentisphaerales bacterium]